MAKLKKARIVILEGSWEDEHEIPQILPYFQALAVTHPNDIEICHRTFRSVEDIKYYVGKIKKDAGVMLYIACHGKNGSLCPAHEVEISIEEVAEALSHVKSGGISFVHFGACEMVSQSGRRNSQELIMSKSGAKWVSGYTTAVDWLPSTFLDLMFSIHIFANQHGQEDGRVAGIVRETKKFFDTYDQTIRALGLSALVKTTSEYRLFPPTLRKK